MRVIEGGCHCGNIRYRLFWPPGDAVIAVRECGCTFCRKHRGIYTSHRAARLEARIADQASVSKYQFGTRTAEFHVCRRCGVVPFVTSRIDGQDHAVVNTSTFEGVTAAELSAAPTDFDGETTDNRLQRRKATWIPDVTVHG